MTRAAVVFAAMQAVQVAEAWRRAATPLPGAAWDRMQSRDLDDADDAVSRLRELAANLGAAP